MLTVTNHKVAGFSPRWRAFPGLTLLFDNPGDSLAAWQGHELVACDVVNDPALDFYRALRRELEGIGIDLLTEQYLFCPLAPASYHVTAWDCVNVGNVDEVHAQHQPEIRQHLAALPQALGEPVGVTELPLASPLITQQAWNIRFRYDRLLKFHNVALGVILRAADDEAAARLQEFNAARDELNQRFRHTYGISASEIYIPHVTLGYFANPTDAERATPFVEEWNDRLAASVGDLTLSFDQISLYGFTDMITFFRRSA